MPELRATFTLAPSSGWPIGAPKGGAWLAPAWNMLPLAARVCRVRNPINGRAAELSADQFAVLSACEGCRSLSEHANNARQKLGVRDQDGATIDKWISDFANAGLLISFDDLATRLQPDRLLVAAPFGGIAIRTCDRPELLERLLQSASTLEARFLTRYPYRVLDDSRLASHRATNRRLVADSGLDCTYEDLSQENKIVEGLRRAFPGAARELDWLCGAAGSGEVTYGRPVNTMLLMSAGQRILMLDDDALLAPRLPPLMSTGLAISSTADELFWFGDQLELERSCPGADLDPVAAHLDCLGQPVQTLYDRFGGGASSKLEVLQLNRDDAPRFGPRATVRLTQNQALGDPGSSLFPYHLLTLPTKSREQAERNPLWRDHLFRERCNWRGQEHARLTPNRPMTLTTLSGLDNGAMLPPTVRAHRNEDLLLGEMTRRMDPQAWLFDLPWALPHFRSPTKQWLGPGVSFPQEPVHFLLDYVDIKGESIVSARADDRLKALSAMLLDLAAATDAHVTDMLEHQAADAASRTRYKIAALLEDATVSGTWKAMLQPWLQSPTLSVQPEVLRARLVAAGVVRDLAQQYGRALAVWPSLWQWSKERGASAEQD